MLCLPISALPYQNILFGGQSTTTQFSFSDRKTKMHYGNFYANLNTAMAAYLFLRFFCYVKLEV